MTKKVKNQNFLNFSNSIYSTSSPLVRVNSNNQNSLLLCEANNAKKVVTSSAINRLKKR